MKSRVLNIGRTSACGVVAHVFLLCMIAVAMVLSSGSYASGDEGGSSPQEKPAAPPINAAPENFSKFETSIKAMLAAAQKRELRVVAEEASQSLTLSQRLGMGSLNEYAMLLLAEGNERLRLRDYDGAALYARKVLEFAPRSTRVLLASLPLVVETHTRDATDQIFAAISSIGGETDFWLRLGSSICYPLLWAMTIAVYIISVVTLVAAPRLLMNCLKRRMPTPLHPLAPLVLLALFIVPIFSGVLFCLAMWGVLLFLLLPEQRWVGVFAGVVIACWGSVLPIRENVALFFQAEGGQALVRALNGDYLSGDEEKLAAFAESRPGDGLALYGYGVALRRRGDFSGAFKILERAERALGEQPFTLAERGIILYQQGKLDDALELHRRAEGLGLASPEFYFNFSKVYIDRLDTQGSRRYMELAQKSDSAKADSLRHREERLGVDAVSAVADIKLPFKFLYRDALSPLAEAQTQATILMSSLSPVGTPVMAVFLGIGVVLGAFLFSGERTGLYNPESRYSVLLRIIPGGSLVMRGHGAWGIVVLSIAIFLLLPLLAWPIGSEKIFAVLLVGTPYYVGFLVLYLLLCPWIGYQQD